MYGKSEDSSIAYKCLEKGADDYIIVPISVPVVKDIWATVWKNKRERKALDLLYEERKKSKKKDALLQNLNLVSFI